MQTTYLLLLVLLGSVSLVLSDDTSTYSFNFEIAMTGPERTCSNADLTTVATKLTRQVGFIINLYLSSQGFAGQVTNVTLAPPRKGRFLDEVHDFDDIAMDTFVDEHVDYEEVRKLRALFTWKTGAAAICRLCPPLSADARRALRSLESSSTISKAKLGAFLNARITSPTQAFIKWLDNMSDKCKESYDEWTSTFDWT